MLPRALCLISLLLLLGGCALVQPGWQRPNQQSAPPLSETQRREVYRRVATDIQQALALGDTSYQKGEYFNALSHYREAAFYDPALPGLQEKISFLEHQIEESSTTYFAKGKHYLPTDPRKALRAFNSAMQTNPGHIEARRLRDELLAKPEISESLSRQEQQLRQLSQKYTGEVQEIIRLQPLVENLLGYQYDNPLGLALKERLTEDRGKHLPSLLRRGKELYQAGRYEQAQAAFETAQSLDSSLDEAKAYLSLIQHQQEIAQLLQRARTHLEKQEYDAAIENAGKALHLEEGNGEARQIIQDAREAGLREAYLQVQHSLEQKKYSQALVMLQKVLTADVAGEGSRELQASARKTLEERLPGILEEGKELYRQNRLKEALEIMQLVLRFGQDSEADIYVKKIQNRLKTIESLQ